MPRINLSKRFHQSIEIYTPSMRFILSHCGANEINNEIRFESLCKWSSTKDAGIGLFECEPHEARDSSHQNPPEKPLSSP